MIGDHRRISFLGIDEGYFFNHDRFAFFQLSIDHNKLFDISWQLGVRHQVAAAA
jgi:hypothetical protein